jgi:uncharacterized protein YjbJ (UPF0337 family)
MNKDQLAGAANDVAGRVQQAAGALTDDDSMHAEGVAREIGGKARQAYGDAVENVRAYAERKPIGAIAAGIGVGILIGLLLSRRGD